MRTVGKKGRQRGRESQRGKGVQWKEGEVWGWKWGWKEEQKLKDGKERRKEDCLIIFQKLASLSLYNY